MEDEQQKTRFEALSAGSDIRISAAKREKMRIQNQPTSRVLRAFQDYVDIGEGRSLKKLHEMYVELDKIHGEGTAPTVSLYTLEYWHRKWNWAVQIKLDAMQLADASRKAKQDRVHDAADRQLQAAQILQRIALSRLSELARLEKISDELSPTEARRMLAEGAKLERDLLGGKDVFNPDDGDEITYE